MEQLVLHGHTLRRPHADLLRDGIYELRAKREGVNYRLLFFFHGRGTAVVSHGITKQGAAVPPAEIARALRRKKTFETNPGRHGSEGA
jgi:phage-related protein